MKIDKNLTKSLALICVFAIIICSFTACGEKISAHTSIILSKEFNAVFYPEKEANTEELFALMSDAAKQTATQLSATDKNSEIYKLNEEKLIYASDTFKKIMEDAVILCTSLSDIVDITMGKPLRLWGFLSGSPAVPDEQELKKAVEDKSIDKIVIAGDSDKITISADMEINADAFSDGVALDRAFREVKSCRIPFTVTYGDTVLVHGEGPDNGKWTVSVPYFLKDGGLTCGTIKITADSVAGNAFVSTAGISKNSFTENGKVYHGILDPETGYPVNNGLASVTVVTESGITADALADALFINGFRESSFSYIESFGAEAVFVFTDGTYYATEGLRDSLKITDSSLTEHTEAPATELF